MSNPANDTCDLNITAALGVDEAIAAMLAQCQPVNRTRRVPLPDAGGRILAEAVTSPIDVPGFDNSAMDGYALHHDDLAEARSTGLPVTQRITAGQAGEPLERGSCARIFTGAPLPAGANAIAAQEICRIEVDRMFLDRDIPAGANIRPRANDIAYKDTILEPGSVLNAARIGLAASVGIDQLRIFRKLRVAIFSTGDELAEPGQELAAGQIYNSNRYLLRELLAAQGCKVIDLGTVPDTFDATRKTLTRAAARADLIITSGGVSVGEEDHVKAALEAVGSLNLWRIRMKPGKPLAFGKVQNSTFIGLPGNPVAVFVTFLLFALPVIRLLQGRKVTTPVARLARAGFSHQSRGRREYLRVQLGDKDGTATVHAFPRQGSDVLSSVAWADGLAEIPENTTLQAGDRVRYYAFADWLQ